MNIFVLRDNRQQGPYSPEDITEHLRSGHFNTSDLAWHEGLEEWAPLSSLTATLESAEHPEPPSSEGYQDYLKREYGEVGSLEDAMSANLATTGKRFLNALIDYCGIMGLGLFIGLLFGFLGVFHFIENLNDFLLGAIFWFCYYVPMETLFARTPGKIITGTKVVTEDGGKPGFKDVLIRTLCRLIPFEPFSFLFSGGTGKPVGWHDSISGTRVVSARADR